MRNLIVFVVVLGCAGGAVADTAQCDAKPFTLNKPKAATQKPAGTATADPAKAKPATPKAAPKTSQAKPKPIADCKEPKKG